LHLFSQNHHTFILFLSQLSHRIFQGTDIRIVPQIKDVSGYPLSLFHPETFSVYDEKEENFVIEVNNLVKRYGDHTAVDHLSFKIEKGKIYGFLGPNGAGKSTTMNMITGYIASTEGTVTIDGHDILEEPEQAKKCIGYLPEMPPLYFDMTVLEYMNFVADLKKIPKDKKKSMVEEVMEMVKISDMRNRLIKNLSKGYRQRVGLAQAILGYPEVIILDEPTVGLDPKQIIEIRDLIKNLKKKHTVILSSHILSEVSAVCDYVLIISHGRLVASDTPDNLGKLAQGSNNLSLLVRGDRDKIRILLGEIPGVKEISITADKDQDGWAVKLSTEENTDIREDVFFKMAENHYPILEMQSRKVSLEEIFLELTEDTKKPEATEKEGEDK
jgi:ABC-2 type transport system ATP-binding protein